MGNPTESFDKAPGLSPKEKEYLKKTDIEKVFQDIKANGQDLYGEIMVNIHKANPKEKLDKEIVSAGLTNTLIVEEIKKDATIWKQYQETTKINTPNTRKNDNIALLQALAAKCIGTIKYKDQSNDIIKILKTTNYFTAKNPIDGYMWPNTTMLFSLIARQELGTNKGWTDVQSFNGEISKELILKMYKFCNPTSEKENKKNSTSVSPYPFLKPTIVSTNQEMPEQKLQNEISSKVNLIKRMYWVDVVSNSEKIEDILNRLKNKYSVDFLSSSQLNPQLDMLNKELSIYPPGFIKNSWIKNIILTKWYIRTDKEIYNWNHEQAWLYTGSDSVVVGSFRWDKSQFVLHHEFYHLLDKQEDWLTKDDKIRKKLWKSSTVSSLNITKPTLDQTAIQETLKQLGYATTSAIENQAVIAGFLIKNPKIVLDLAKTDDVMKRKIEVLTWCKINASFTWFERDYSWPQFVYAYGKYGFTGREYYAKWSNGMMNYTWRNARIRARESV